MLARIASARSGERIASVTTDAKFFVVLAFIGFVCPTVNATLVCLATRMTFTTAVPVARGDEDCGFIGWEVRFVACGLQRRVVQPGLFSVEPNDFV
jgi:hypothetical protein